MMRPGNGGSSPHSRNDSTNSNHSHASSSSAPSSPHQGHQGAAEAAAAREGTIPDVIGKTNDSVVSVTFQRTPTESQTASPRRSGKGNSKVTRDLMKLSVHERERINEEIHGVTSMAITESPELIARCLSQMEQAVAAKVVLAEQQQQQQQQFSQHGTSPPPSPPAFVEAQRMGALYLQQPSFRLQFLRATLFDANLAAERLFDFSQVIRDVLGIEALLKMPISLNHFAFDEHNLLREGCFQILPGRDRVGRRITGLIGDFGLQRSLAAKFRVALYVMMAASEDEDTQKRGVVSLFYQHSSTTRMLNDPQERVMFARLFDAIPLRISAVHVCLSNDCDEPSKLQELQAYAMDSYGTDARKRTRLHTGSPANIISSLETFGIPAELIPINSNSGKRKTSSFAKWINLRLAREEQVARAANAAAAASIGRISAQQYAQQQLYTFPWIECPGRSDVLLGRGRPIMNHQGNVQMRELVGSNLGRFNAATDKQTRTTIIEEVVMEIQASGGRFLKEDHQNMNGFWVEVDQQAAFQKVGIYFRDLRCSTGAPAAAASVYLNITTSSSSFPPSPGSSRGTSPSISGGQSSTPAIMPGTEGQRSPGTPNRGSKRKASDD